MRFTSSLRAPFPDAPFLRPNRTRRPQVRPPRLRRPSPLPQPSSPVPRRRRSNCKRPSTNSRNRIVTCSICSRSSKPCWKTCSSTAACRAGKSSLSRNAWKTLSFKTPNCKTRSPTSKRMPQCVPPVAPVTAPAARRTRFHQHPAGPTRAGAGRRNAAALHLSAAARLGRSAGNQIVAPAFHAERRRHPADRSLPNRRPDVAGALA